LEQSREVIERTRSVDFQKINAEETKLLRAYLKGDLERAGIEDRLRGCGLNEAHFYWVGVVIATLFVALFIRAILGLNELRVDKALIDIHVSRVAQRGFVEKGESC